MQARRSLVWVVVVIAVALVVWWFGGDGTAPAGAPDRSAGAHDAPVERATAPVALEDASSAPVDARTSVVDEQPLAPTITRAESGRALLTGVLVDANGAPIADAELRLTKSSPWIGGDDARVFEGTRTSHGYATTSAADGRFHFDVPAPEPVVCRLSIEPNEYLERVDIDFGPRSRHGQSELSTGTRDLGSVRLAACGVVRGRVVDEHGAAIADALATLVASSGGMGRSARTAATGEFRLAHVTPGSYSVEARRPGKRLAAVHAVEVSGGVDSDIGVLVLHEAPTISGTVRDDEGRPIAKASIHGYAVEGLRAAHPVESDADGRFVLALYEDTPHTLIVSAEGHEQLGDYFDEHMTFASGTRDLAFVLARLDTIRFLVVDAATRTPIEAFAIRVLSGEGSASGVVYDSFPERLPPTTHVGGVHEAVAQPGRDAVLVQAPGYTRFEDDVAFDVDGVPVQTIALERAGGVSGRAWRDGAPVAGAPVTLVKGHLWRPMSFTPAGSTAAGEFPEHAPWFRADDPNPLSTTTDADGRFSIDIDETGTFKLVVDVGPSHSLTQWPLDIDIGERLDLGDLTAVASGAIEGTVLVADGTSAIGLMVQLDGPGSRVCAAVDAEGRFRLDDVDVGHHEVNVAVREPDVTDVPSQVVEVRAGETTHVEFDARAAAPCELEVHFVVAGVDVRGWSAYVVGRHGTARPSVDQLGAVGDGGFVRGRARPTEHGVVHLDSPLGPISFDERPLELPSGGSLVVELTLEVATIEFRLPRETELPPTLDHRLDLHSSFGTDVARAFRCRWVERDGVQTYAAGQSAVDGGFTIAVPTGTYDIDWSVSDANAPVEDVVLENGDHARRRPQLLEHSSTISVVKGERVVVQLE